MKYMMHQKIFSLGKVFIIRDEEGQDRYRVNAKVFSMGDKLSFQDTDGRELAYIRQRLMKLTPTYEIWRDGELVAVVEKKLFTLLHHRFVVDEPGPDDLVATGDLLGYEYRFARADGVRAVVSKKWFTLVRTYGVDVAPNEDDVLVLAATVVIDLCCNHDETV